MFELEPMMSATSSLPVGSVKFKSTLKHRSWSLVYIEVTLNSAGTTMLPTPQGYLLICHVICVLSVFMSTGTNIHFDCRYRQVVFAAVQMRYSRSMKHCQWFTCAENVEEPTLEAYTISLPAFPRKILCRRRIWQSFGLKLHETPLQPAGTGCILAGNGKRSCTNPK